MFPTQSLWSGEHSIASSALFSGIKPWELLVSIEGLIEKYMHTQSPEDWKILDSSVYIHKTADIHSSAVIQGPALIGAHSELRPGAYIRGHVILGEGVVIGNSCEIKQAIIFDEAQVPHFNYVGDSILGYKAHLGAGVVLSNYRADYASVSLTFPDHDGALMQMDSGRRKLGAILGDRSEIGCNSVLNPGTVVGSDARIYPLSSVRGYIPPRHIYKRDGLMVLLEDK